MRGWCGRDRLPLPASKNCKTRTTAPTPPKQPHPPTHPPTNLHLQPHQPTSRPARTWFQSEHEKQTVKDNARAVAEGRAPARTAAEKVGGACSHRPTHPHHHPPPLTPTDQLTQPTETNQPTSNQKAKDPKHKRKEKLKEKRAAEREAGGGKKVPTLAEETEEQTRKVKSIKSKTRELQAAGLPASKAAKIAAAAVTGESLRDD
jgi:hypothetical protein